MTSKRNKLLIATHNGGKIIELTEMLDGLPIDLISLKDFPNAVEVDESGSTFGENARLKATGYALQTGLAGIADDSGLEIAALDGRPGILSARYGGVESGFDEKMALILDELTAAEDRSRHARFVCSIAVAAPDGIILHQSEGFCNGSIAAEPRGIGGFGYDPLFIPDGYEMTFAELSTAVKSEISHRSRAFRLIIPFLRDFMAD
jgi:XTP/dITP diphosphohydrolase